MWTLTRNKYPPRNQRNFSNLRSTCNRPVSLGNRGCSTIGWIQKGAKLLQHLEHPCHREVNMTMYGNKSMTRARAQSPVQECAVLSIHRLDSTFTIRGMLVKGLIKNSRPKTPGKRSGSRPVTARVSYGQLLVLFRRLPYPTPFRITTLPSLISLTPSSFRTKLKRNHTGWLILGELRPSPIHRALSEFGEAVRLRLRRLCLAWMNDRASVQIRHFPKAKRT